MRFRFFEEKSLIELIPSSSGEIIEENFPGI